MEDSTPKVPITKEVQPEVKDVSQTLQKPPADSKTPPKPTPPAKPKKKLKLKVLIILIIVLVSLVTGGFFVWRNISAPDTEKAKEEVYIYKGIWLPGLTPGWLASNIQKIKDLGMNTVSLSVEFIQEDGNPLTGVDTSHIVEDIQVAHENGMKVMLNANFHPKPKLEEKDIERLNSLIIEVAKIAEENDVELFAPLSEPETVLLVDRGEWAQDILHKIKEVYHGEMFWNGTFAPPDKEVVSEEYFRQVAEQPPGDFVGYDYIGFASYYFPEESLEPEELTQFADQLTLESYAEYTDRLVKYMLAYAQRDGCKGVIVKEFGVYDRFFMSGDDVVDRLDNGTLTEEELARSYEIVFEKGKDGVSGFLTTIDILETEIYGIHIRGVPETQELIKKWFTEVLPEKKTIYY